MLVTSPGALPAPCAGWRAMIDCSVGPGLGGRETRQELHLCLRDSQGLERILVGIKDLSLPPSELVQLCLIKLSRHWQDQDQQP